MKVGAFERSSIGEDLYFLFCGRTTHRIFLETHEDPENAPSDGPNMVPLKEIKKLLKKITEIDKIIKQ